MQFIDLKAQQERIGSILEERIAAVLAHGHYILGPEVAELEKELALRTGTQRCVTCANGTDALLMALRALGIGPGHAVLTTAFSFIASADVISMAGATPVFLDIDPLTYNVDPGHLAHILDEIKRGGSVAGTKISGVEASCVIAVDLFGLAADFDRVKPVIEKHELHLIEDAAQSFGGRSQTGACGGLAPLATTSFFPAKPLGCYGDGGAIFCNDADLAEVLLSLRMHGKGSHKYENVRIGLNSRLDTMQAAILLAKLTLLDEEMQLRHLVADRYTSGLDGAVRTPYVPAGHMSAWAQYTIEVNDRDDLARHLGEKGIPSAVYYPRPLHLQPVFNNLGYQPGSLPVCERIAEQVLCLPMHPYLDEKTQDRVIDAILKWTKEKM